MAFNAVQAGLHSHADQNGLSADKHLYMDFLKRLHASGILNKTVLFLGGDHGCRFKFFKTHVGNHEARLPLMYGIFPEWFRKKYPTAYENFKYNGLNRMTSQHDLYYTMKAILNKDFTNPKSDFDPKSHYGMNLLARVPETRTCADAGVSAHFCACGSKTQLEKTDTRALKAGKILVTKVNEILKGTPCVEYKEFDIIEAYLSYPREDITITIETKPVYASLRTTLSLHGNQIQLSDIERLERYVIEPTVTLTM